MRVRPRVLLVDGSIDEREMYAEYLRMRGYCTLQAATAHDGFRMAADLAPAVVVTDINLCGAEDGLALTARLEHDTTTRDMVIVRGFGCGEFRWRRDEPPHPDDGDRLPKVKE